jgi:hypothetical protein
MMHFLSTVLQATDIPTETTSHTVTSAWIKNPLRKQHSGKTKHEVKLNAICIIGCTSEGPVFATESMPLNDNIFWNEVRIQKEEQTKGQPFCKLNYLLLF